MDDVQLAQKEGNRVNFGQFTLPPSNLPLYYGDESGEDADDEGGRYVINDSSIGHRPSLWLGIRIIILLSSMAQHYTTSSIIVPVPTNNTNLIFSLVSHR